MKNYKLILPVEHQYLNSFGKPGSPMRVRFLRIFDYFFQKGIQDFIVIGTDLWRYIPLVKSKYCIKVIAGGKINSIRMGDKALAMGADQIILARHFYQKSDSIKRFAKHFGNKLICSVDDESGHIEGTTLLTYDFIKIAQKAGVKNFIYVNCNSKLSLKGVDMKGLSIMTKLIKPEFMYSGGVATPKDIKKLMTVGVEEIVVGTALYKAVLNIEGLGIDFKKGKGLVPAIIQDLKNNEVLMLGYMNREAFSKTCETGLAHFWSRERKKLWMKGEESGNKLKVSKICLDCDKDTILIKATLLGKTVCHTGKYSCFSERTTVD